MPNVNFSDSGHLTPPPVPQGVRFLPFDRVMDRQRIVQLEAAMRFIESRLAGNKVPRCEQAFRALPNGLSFSEVWADPRIWISFTTSVLARGFTHPNGVDVAISLVGFQSPILWRTVAATLIHELAHVNGAASSTRDAESVLLHCLLADHHDPAIVG